jgi:hypothetical protein
MNESIICDFLYPFILTAMAFYMLFNLCYGSHKPFLIESLWVAVQQPSSFFEFSLTRAASFLAVSQQKLPLQYLLGECLAFGISRKR